MAFWGAPVAMPALPVATGRFLGQFPDGSVAKSMLTACGEAARYDDRGASEWTARLHQSTVFEERPLLAHQCNTCH